MNEKTRILIVEDEVAIRTGLIDVFTYHGYEAAYAAEGGEGLRMALGGQFDLVLLDVMLPGIDGFRICQRIREQRPDQAVIMLTAKTDDDDIIHGLSLGADDYVAKPFSVTQLLLRVQAVLRRTRPAAPSAEHIRLRDGLALDVLNLSGSRDGEALGFTRREMDVLTYLHANRERPVSREELLSRVWGYARDLNIETRTVDIHVAKLRRKIETDPKSPKHLLTVRGAGYRLVGD
ncbi:MAG: response regulator transcription factor [Sedimenticolaceae bacterium]